MLMPFGKHKGKPLKDIPRDYIAWLSGQEIRDPDLAAAVAAEHRLRQITVEEKVRARKKGFKHEERKRRSMDVSAKLKATIAERVAALQITPADVAKVELPAVDVEGEARVLAAMIVEVGCGEVKKGLRDQPEKLILVNKVADAMLSALKGAKS